MSGGSSFDLTVFRSVDPGWRNPVLDIVFLILTTSGVGWCECGLSLLFLPWQAIRSNTGGIRGLLAGWRTRTPLTVPILINFLVTGGITQVLKTEIPRDRPSNLPWSNPQELIYAHSFPSGHTSSAFGIAFTILFLTRASSKAWYGWAALAWALLVGLSRIYRGVHWPTDVLAGLLLGLACAAALTAFSPRAFFEPGETKREEDNR